jgi:capsule polysaccharide export protein KpsE/RkpR
VNPAKGSAAHVVERPQEVEASPTAYMEEGIDVARRTSSDWAWILWERRRFLGRAALWGLVVSTMIAFLIPKQYESTTRLMPPDNQSSSGMAMMAAFAGGGTGKGAGAGLTSLAGDLLGLKNSGDLFVDILHSRTVEDRLIERFDLRRVYWDKYWVDARKDLAKKTAVSADRKSGVITITVTDRDSRRAAQIAQAYVEELDRLVAMVSTSSARRQRIFIEERLKTVKSDLDTVSQQFSDYASKNATIDVTAQGKAMVEGAAKLEGELIAAKAGLEGLEQIYTPNNTRVRSMQARVDELQRQLHQLGGDVPGSAADSAASSTQQDFPSIRKLPQLAVKWTDLYRQTKIQETVYELLTQQYELAKIEEAKEIPVVKVLDVADLPERKSSPQRMLIGFLGMLMAFLAGCTWILAKREWDSRDRSNPQKAFLLEVGASIKADAQHLWLISFNGRNRDGYEGRNGGSRRVSAVADDSREGGTSSVESSNN